MTRAPRELGRWPRRNGIARTTGDSRRPGSVTVTTSTVRTRLSFTAVGSDVLTPPKEKIRGTGPGNGLGRPCSVIVLNDSHNTFEGVATILSQFVPGVDYAKGMAFAKTIHEKGQATVWRGDAERAELVWEQLKDAGLSMAPLTDG